VAKRVYIDLSGEGVGVDDAEHTPQQQDNEETIQAFLDDFGSGSVKLSLYRLKPGTAKWEWLAHYIPDAVTPETIRQEWGAGSFALTLLDERGHYITRRTFEIGGNSEDWERARITQGHSGTGEKGSGSQDTLVELMREQHQTMLTLLGNKGGGGLSDSIELAKLLKGETSDPMKQLEYVTAIVKLSRSLGGGSDDSVAGLIKEVAPALLGPFMQNSGKALPAAPNGNGTAQAAGKLPPVREVAPAPKADEPPAAGVDDAPPDRGDAGADADTQALLFSQFQYWKVKARKPGSDPDFWVDYVFENDDEPAIKAVLWAVRTYPFSALQQFDPELRTDAALADWFGRLYNGIRAELHRNVDSTGAGGDARDAGGDAGADSEGRPEAGDAGSGAGDSEREPAAKSA